MGKGEAFSIVPTDESDVIENVDWTEHEPIGRGSPEMTGEKGTVEMDQ